VLGQGTEARMNVPGTAAGNWGYRVRSELLSSSVAAKLTRLTETYERLPSSLRRDP
jgi:4-alpha-glucanotransferase